MGAVRVITKLEDCRSESELENETQFNETSLDCSFQKRGKASADMRSTVPYFM